MIHIGFTGTQRGMTEIQARVVYGLLRYKDFYAHHGVCVGSDHQFDEIVRRIPGCRGVILHPCTIAEKQAPIVPNHPRDVLRPVKPPLARNQDIVDESHVLVATPGAVQEQLRSGTWSTIRYARKQKKPLVIVGPDGWYLSEEGGPWPA